MHIQYTYINKKGVKITSKSRSMKLKESTPLLIEVYDNGIKGQFRYTKTKEHICECGHKSCQHNLYDMISGFNASCLICDCKGYKEILRVI